MYPSTGGFTNKQQLEDWILGGGHKAYLDTDPALRKLFELIGEKVSVDLLYVLLFLHNNFTEFRVIKKLKPKVKVLFKLFLYNRWF